MFFSFFQEAPHKKHGMGIYYKLGIQYMMARRRSWGEFQKSGVTYPELFYQPANYYYTELITDNDIDTDTDKYMF